MPVHDILGRPISVGDFVVFYSNIYEVLRVLKADKYGHGMLLIRLVHTSPTTKSVRKPGGDCCIVPKEDVLLWALKKDY